MSSLRVSSLIISVTIALLFILLSLTSTHESSTLVSFVTFGAAEIEEEEQKSYDQPDSSETYAERIARLEKNLLEARLQRAARDLGGDNHEENKNNNPTGGSIDHGPSDKPKGPAIAIDKENVDIHGKGKEQQINTRLIQAEQKKKYLESEIENLERELFSVEDARGSSLLSFGEDRDASYGVAFFYGILFQILDFIIYPRRSVSDILGGNGSHYCVTRLQASHAQSPYLDETSQNWLSQGWSSIRNLGSAALSNRKANTGVASLANAFLWSELLEGSSVVAQSGFVSYFREFWLIPGRVLKAVTVGGWDWCAGPFAGRASTDANPCLKIEGQAPARFILQSREDSLWGLFSPLRAETPLVLKPTANIAVEETATEKSATDSSLEADETLDELLRIAGVADASDVPYPTEDTSAKRSRYPKKREHLIGKTSSHLMEVGTPFSNALSVGQLALMMLASALFVFVFTVIKFGCVPTREMAPIIEEAEEVVAKTEKYLEEVQRSRLEASSEDEDDDGVDRANSPAPEPVPAIGKLLNSRQESPLGRELPFHSRNKSSCQGHPDSESEPRSSPVSLGATNNNIMASSTHSGDTLTTARVLKDTSPLVDELVIEQEEHNTVSTKKQLPTSADNIAAGEETPIYSSVISKQSQKDATAPTDLDRLSSKKNESLSIEKNEIIRQSIVNATDVEKLATRRKSLSSPPPVLQSPKHFDWEEFRSVIETLLKLEDDASTHSHLIQQLVIYCLALWFFISFFFLACRVVQGSTAESIVSFFVGAKFAVFVFLALVAVATGRSIWILADGLASTASALSLAEREEFVLGSGANDKSFSSVSPSRQSQRSSPARSHSQTSAFEKSKKHRKGTRAGSSRRSQRSLSQQ